jgi:hypothetical protein
LSPPLSGLSVSATSRSGEVAKAVVLLACDASSFIDGIELFVEGGMAQM